MRWNDAALVESTVWEMRLADLPRGENRALIDRLGNGLPPFTKREQEASRVKTNVNFLEFPELCADARRSYYNAFLKTGTMFNIALDFGPATKRTQWSRILTKELNKILKGSAAYFEFLRSQIAMTVLHGIGPGVWPNADKWCPSASGIEDVMIPSNTLLTMENLPYVAIYKEMTAMELYKETHGYRVDPAWQMDVVDGAITWAQEQVRAQPGYADIYAPQKVEDRWKQDLGFFGSDAVPTINCWDFYFWSDMDGKDGWRRRMIIDTPCSYEVVGRRKVPIKDKRYPAKNSIGADHGHWLYRPDDNRVYAEDLGNIIRFQFGDASAVAPFKYHGVRGLGWLLYAVCHLQNRLRCRVNDAVFEALLQYFRMANEDDRERILKIDLHHLGVIPNGVSFVPPADRWKIDQALVSLGLGQNQERMQKAAAQFREGKDDTNARKEKTATEIMAEVNAANALVGGMLLQAYQYHEFQGREICRRFARKDSKDPDVLKFRNLVMKKGVPEKYIDNDFWEVSVERVMGSGNKTLQIAMAEKIMAVYGSLTPAAQKVALHEYIFANTDDPEKTNVLAPLDEREDTDAKHDAENSVGSLLQGQPVRPKRGESQIDVIETWLTAIGKKIKEVGGRGLPAPFELSGLQNMAANIAARIQILANDKPNAQKAKGYEKALGEVMKVIGAMQKALQKAAQQPMGGNGADPEAAKENVKLRGKMQMDAVKAKNAAVAHAQKTKQRDVQFRAKMEQDKARHQFELGKDAQRAQLEAASKDLLTAAEIRNSGIRAMNEAKGDDDGSE